MWCWSSRGASWARVTLIGLSSAAALFFVVLLAYQLALARVPQHRAALESLLRGQTGLDVRFSTLGVRWGWYGPEAVFRNVELGEPGSSNVLLRAPELTVGFDAWRTMRSGQLEAGRIALLAPDINLERVGSESRTVHARAAAHDTPGVVRARLLERWRDGRIDIEGGTLRLPDPNGAATPFLLQIRRASLRRSGDEWNLFTLLFLPERLGRTARVAMRLEGGLDRPDTLSGSLRFEGRRLSFAGWRDFSRFAPGFVAYAPVSGGGDVTVHLDFARGRIEKADGDVHAGGVALGSPGTARTLSLDRLRGQWRLVRRGSGWRVRVEALELGAPTGEGGVASKPASLLVDAAQDGVWARGKLEHAPLQAVAIIARWLAPHFDVAGVELGGTARDVVFDWDSRRQSGRKLATTAHLEDVSVTPPSHAFVLSGMTARVSGNEVGLDADVTARAARLELAGAPQYPLEAVQVASQLRFGRADEGWQIATERLELRHSATRLELSGTLTGGGARLQPEMAVQGELTAAEVPFVQRVLGSGVTEAFGAAAAAVTAGQVERAQFDLRGPLEQSPGADKGESSGSVMLRDAVVSGGDRWPDATGVTARVQWHGADVRVIADAGQAGPFQLANASAEWQATGEHFTHVTAQVHGRLEDAVAWVRDHPDLTRYVPQTQSFGLEGAVQLDFDVSLPADGKPTTRVVAWLEGASLSWVSGAVPIQAVTGSFAFDGGRLQRSTLTGTWLGGPVTLRVREARERGQPVVAMQAQGTLSARELATLESIDTQGRLEGSADWTGDFTFLPASESQPARWHVRADSNLVGVASELPEPFAKVSSAALPLHIDVSGSDVGAQLRVTLGERLRSVLALERTPESGWRVERGAVNLGLDSPAVAGTPIAGIGVAGTAVAAVSGAGIGVVGIGAASAVLPTEPLVRVQGRVSRLDLPTYLGPWLNSWFSVARPARLDRRTPPVQAQISAAEVIIAGRSYPDVTLIAGRTDSDAQLQFDSTTLAGAVRWPLSAAGSRPAEILLTRLNVPRRSEEGGPAAILAVAAAMDSVAVPARLSIDELTWEGMRLGHLTATLAARDQGLALDDVRVSGSTHDGTGTVRCQAALASCRAVFTVESSDAAATLADFGFRPDLSASKAQLSGELEWEPHADPPWVATLVGRVSMKMIDGATHAGTDADGRPFALAAVPALVSAMEPPGSDGSSRPPPRELRFARLEADFDLKDGQASTSDLHFDGDAEILMRGRTGLVAHDYDQQVWVLRGEERLPAAVRRLGPTPRVAAAWLTLRELFAADADRARAQLRLQGSWDEPVVVSANP